MGLKEAVAEIADQIEEDAEGYRREMQKSGESGTSVTLLLVGYVRQLRSAVKAAADEPRKASAGLPDGMVRCGRCHGAFLPGKPGEALCPPCRLDVRKREQREEDGKAVTHAEVADGPAFVEGMPTLVPIDQAMPKGARTLVAGEVYELRDGRKLWHVPLESLQK